VRRQPAPATTGDRAFFRTPVLDSRPMRRLVLAIALLAVVAAGCGQSEGETHATTEGVYLEIGGLAYQIEMSRYMNANDIEDREYLKGLSSGTAQPGPDETWFGVWVRVENFSGEARPAADTWEIRDTLDKIYRPIPIDTDSNVFAFQKGIEVPPGVTLPLPSTAAGQGPIQGSLLLFKIKNDSLQNRPLELRFSNGSQGEIGSYDLDV
jgi:hypothetical protein